MFLPMKMFLEEDFFLFLFVYREEHPTHFPWVGLQLKFRFPEKLRVGHPPGNEPQFENLD